MSCMFLISAWIQQKAFAFNLFFVCFCFLCVGEEQVSADIHSHESNDYNILGVIASTHRPAHLQLSDSWQASILIYSSNDYQTSSNISVVTINITNYPAHQGNSVIVFAAFFTYTSLNVLHLWFKYNSVILFAVFFTYTSPNVLHLSWLRCCQGLSLIYQDS